MINVFVNDFGINIIYILSGIYGLIKEEEKEGFWNFFNFLDD